MSQIQNFLKIAILNVKYLIIKQTTIDYKLMYEK